MGNVCCVAAVIKNSVFLALECLKYVCVFCVGDVDVMDVVFSVCIVRRGAVGASCMGECGCFVMQMLYVYIYISYTGQCFAPAWTYHGGRKFYTNQTGWQIFNGSPLGCSGLHRFLEVLRNTHRYCYTCQYGAYRETRRRNMWTNLRFKTRCTWILLEKQVRGLYYFSLIGVFQCIFTHHASYIKVIRLNQLYESKIGF